MKASTKLHAVTSSLAFTLVIGAVACATPKPPQTLLDARAAYADATANAATSAPTELRAAEDALDQAEAEFRENPTAPDVADLAYVALRKAELASTKARTYAENRRLSASTARLQRVSASAAEQLRATKERLEQTETSAQTKENELRDVEQRAAQLETQLESSKTALESQSGALDEAQQKLDQEREARRAAEEKLTTMLQGMQNLQSVKEEQRGLVITLSGQVLFASGQWQLLPAARAALDNVADALKSEGDRKITVEGYTDTQGSPSSNLVLSQARAEAVRRYLVSRGVDEDRIRATGMGQDNPVAPNTTTEGRANNRRVEIVLAPAKTEPR